ncbi:MAG: (2Fe-2S) ferredoxin domain-containing protein [Clostridiales bacterium]|jgi:NADH:ubiquinone oxidoreductase subunit E|nr:(2Fe-2S) ferredoxin domain-containing protein [Clostridiales bacterium]
MEITICIGSSCHLKGSRDVIRILERLVAQNHLENSVTLKGSFCMGECAKDGVCVRVDDELFHVTPAETESFFNYEVLKRLKGKPGGAIE